MMMMMANFEYKAIDLASKEVRQGIFVASNELQARQKIREMNLVPLALKEVGDKAAGGSKGIDLMGLFAGFQKIGRKDVIAFTRNMAIMVRGGIPLTEGLLYFEKFSTRPKFKAMVAQLRGDILGGDSFSNALARFPKLYSGVFINITRAGELSGELDVTLERVADLLTRQEKIKGKVVSASIYPIIVLCLVGIVLVVIFTFVLPSFAKIYQQMGVELPAITQFMILISDLLRNWWYISFPTIFASIWGFLQFVKTPTGRRIVDTVNLRVPVLKEVVSYLNISQFVSTLAVCFNSGIPITEALNYAVATVNNVLLKVDLEGVNNQVQVGKRLGVALAETGVIPELVLLVLATGEESGNLEQSLNTAQEYLEKEINERIEILMAFMEPLLLLFLGVVVGFVALAIYMPMFSMYENMN
jgi:type II secretory pathway component PulF